MGEYGTGSAGHPSKYARAGNRTVFGISERKGWPLSSTANLRTPWDGEGAESLGSGDRVIRFNMMLGLQGMAT